MDFLFPSFLNRIWSLSASGANIRSGGGAASLLWLQMKIQPCLWGFIQITLNPARATVLIVLAAQLDAMREACVRKVHSPRVTSLSARTEGSVPEPQNTPTKSKCVTEVWFYIDENDTLTLKRRSQHTCTQVSCWVIPNIPNANVSLSCMLALSPSVNTVWVALHPSCV